MFIQTQPESLSWNKDSEKIEINDESKKKY